MNFGEKLKTLRTERRKSQVLVVRELQARFPELNMSQAYLSNLESREGAPREELLCAFAQYYGVSMSVFLGSYNQPVSTELALHFLEDLRKRDFSKRVQNGR